MNLELEIINRGCNEILFSLEELQNSIDLIESLLTNKINFFINNRNNKIYTKLNNKIKVNSQKKNICLNISKKLVPNFDTNIKNENHMKKPKKKTRKKRNRIVRSVIVIDTSDESDSD